MTTPADFCAWALEVDAEVFRRAGCSLYDLPDVALADWHDEGLTPARAAARAIKSAKGEE